MRKPLFALALVLVLSLVGCSAASEPAGPEPAPDTADEQISASDFSYLTGSWTVTTELTGIDNPMMTAAADQPGATWECVVTGDTMILVTDQHEHTGTLRPEAESGWAYEASSTFTDEDGYTVTSTISVNGKPTSTDRNAFVGGMTGTIDTADGHLYAATWDIQGTRN